MATMLHWLAGAKTADNINDSSAAIDPPETPAPVFAVKAFRHALFGTPQTAQRPQARRHSTVEQNRPRVNVESPKPTRPRMERPKSASDANALTLPPSPTKGILMTPGTAAGRKKNVTFGEHVVDNQEKKPTKSGVPDDCPGKFPSPWAAKGGEAEKDAPTAEKGTGRGRNKLTEAFEQAREESRQRQRSGEDAMDGGRVRVPADENECCEYWSREYEAYRTNTQREVKKLVKKYKAAKDYAQSKDDEASDLRLHLQEAETKADALEEAVNLLTSQIKEMEERLRAQPEIEKETLVPAANKQERERERPRDLLALLERRGSKERTVSSTTVRTNENDQLQRPSEPKSAVGRRAPDTERLQKSSEASGAVDRRKQDATKPSPPSDALVPAKEATQPAPLAAGRTPAGIAARWAAVKDAPQRPSEGAHLTAHKRDTELAPTHSSHPMSSTKPLPERPTALTRTRDPPASASAPAPAQAVALLTDDFTAPPGPLHAPSEPAVYSPPPNSTHTNPKPPAPPQHQATVEDEPIEAPPPPPPRHASGTLSERRKIQRKDSGLDSGGTLKVISGNTRSGSDGSGGGEKVDGAEVKKVGRDGKEIDQARLEAAKARLRNRGRDVS